MTAVRERLSASIGPEATAAFLNDFRFRLQKGQLKRTGRGGGEGKVEGRGAGAERGGGGGERSGGGGHQLSAPAALSSDEKQVLSSALSAAVAWKGGGEGAEGAGEGRACVPCQTVMETVRWRRKMLALWREVW